MTEFTYTLDRRTRPRVGLVVLQADETIESEMPTLLDGRADLHVSRVPSGVEVTRETLEAMRAHLPAAAELFPSGMQFACIGYGCTSGASVIGSAQVAQLISGSVITDAVTDPVSALVAACSALQLRRLALLSPYVADVSSGLQSVLHREGIETPVFGSFNVAEEAKVARISASSIIEGACAIGADARADAVFLSCTNLRTIEIVSEIEQRLQKPVLTSTQVLAWHIATLSGFAPLEARFGRLMRAA